MSRTNCWLLRGTLFLLSFGLLNGCASPPPESGHDAKHPELVAVQWGKVTVQENGKHVEYKDCIITPDGSVNWNFNANATVNSPRTSHQISGDSKKRDATKGIQRHEVEPFLHLGKVFILSTGMEQKLGVNRDTVDFLEKAGKKVFVVPTQDVKKTYDEFSLIEKTVVLIHSTC